MNDGLSVNFNGPGYVVTDSTYGPGTAFMAGITSIGDVDEVGYFNLNETVNNGQGWAGAFIRLACGNTYPDQWNASGEANGCGSSYGYFVNKEGIPGTYLVEILNRTSSIQFLNGNFGRSINIDYPLYPAHVGFDGAFTSISVQWAAVMNLPPNGVMPSFNVSNQVYPAGSNPNVAVPSGIIYYIPIQIANDQPVPTPNEYQQLVIVNSSTYSKFEAPNLDNVEFFYANGTVIPSWLESYNELTGTLSISVEPALGSTLVVNGQIEPLINGSFTLSNTPYGTYNIFVENPTRQFYYNAVDLNSSELSVTVHLANPITLNSTSYPWVPLGPAYFPNPQGPDNVIQFASGHSGQLAIDESNPKIIYDASGTFVGDSGPYSAGGVYRTTDGGVTWTPINLGLPYGDISSIYLNQSNPDQLLVGFVSGGIYRTDDAGGYWTKVSGYDFAKDFVDVNGTLLAGSSQGVIESRDSGRSWTLILSLPNVRGLSVSHRTIYALSLDGLSLYKSTDFGNSWAKVYSFSDIAYDVWSIQASPWNSSIVYVCIGKLQGTQSSAWVSYDGGHTFEPNQGVEATRDAYGNAVNCKGFLFDPVNQSRIWAFGPAYLAYSVDGGMTYHTTAQGTDNGGELIIDSKNDSILVLGSDQGIYESFDSGVTWKSINGNLSDVLVYSLAVGEDGQFIILDMQDYSALQTYDGGKVWLGGNTPPIYLAGEGTMVFVNPYNSSWVYAISPSSQLLVSHDMAHSFAGVAGVTGFSSYCCETSSMFYADPYNHSEVLLGTEGGVYLGSSYGAYWHLVSGSPTKVTAVSMSGPTRYLAGTTDGLYIYAGGSWSRSSGISGYIDSIAVDPADNNTILVSTGDYSNGSIYVSRDGGISFELVDSNLNLVYYATAPAIPSLLYFLNTSGYPLLATTNSGIYISLDQGAHWYSISYNLNSGWVTGAQLVGSNLYISTYGEGVLVYPNFSIDSLPGTINGYTNVNNLNITINGQPINTYEGHFRVFLKPGNYTLSYLLNGVAKNIIINVKPMGTYNISINATPYQNYTITFTETGLPPGTQWSVTFNGVTKTSTTSNITFTGVPAGNYTWNATSIIAMGNGTRYVAPTSSGTISVPATTSFNVSYVKQYIVTIESTAGGSTIPSGTSWYNAGSNVSITAIPASGYEFVGWETNSSIAFTNSSSAATNAIINSAGTIVATFKAIPSSPQPSSYTLEYIVAAVFIVIVILAAVLLIRRRK